MAQDLKPSELVRPVGTGTGNMDVLLTVPGLAAAEGGRVTVFRDSGLDPSSME